MILEWVHSKSAKILTYLEGPKLHETGVPCLQALHLSKVCSFRCRKFPGGKFENVGLQEAGRFLDVDTDLLDKKCFELNRHD